MTKNKFGEFVYNESDLIDMIMSGQDLVALITDSTVVIDSTILDQQVITLQESDTNLTVTEYDKIMQSNWYMPDQYKQMDIAEHVLNMCDTDAKLQRVGAELLMYQERNLFDLLRYLKYLVDTMKSNNIIWGVGRGSSVASYVLYLLEVHKIDSMYYDLQPDEFLR
jgi:hypothetical protein